MAFLRFDHSFTKITGIVTSAVACVVLIGWISNIPVLTSVVPDYVTMKFNTAICFLLSGVALLYLTKSKDPYNISVVCSGLVVFVGMITLSQHLFGWNSGMDQFLWQDKITTTRYPGRMSPATSINFILIGSALLLVGNYRYRKIVQIAALATLGISILAFVVNDFTNEYLNILPFLTTMAVHTALIFILLSVGILYSPFVRDLRFSLEWKLAGSFVVIIFVALAAFYIFSKNNKDVITTSRWIEHTSDVLYASEQVVSAVKDIQTGTRGFLITGNETFLTPFNSALQNLDNYTSRLRNLTGDNPIQQARVDSLGMVIDKTIAFNRMLIDLQRSERSKYARDSIGTQIGENLMNRIRAISDKIQHEEKLLLQKRKEVSQKASEKTSLVASIFQTVIVLILITALIIVQRNTKARNKAEAELENSKEWFATTLSSIGDAVIATDNHGLVTYMNLVAQDLTGWTESDARGVPLDVVFDIINEKTRNVVESPVKKALEHGKAVGLANHTLLIRKDKTEVPIDDSAAPITDSRGKMMGVVLVFRDVTEQKKNETALRESEEKFQKAFHASAAGITITRVSDATYLEVNEAFVQMTGYAREELLGHSSAELGIIISLQKREEVLQQIREEGSAKNFEMTARHKSGGIFEVLASVETILLKNVKYAINIIYDISDRKKAEGELESVNKEMEAFSYSVSHDLRAPLRSVIGYSKMLQEDYSGKFDSEGKRQLEIVQKNALKMNNLIDDLLTFSKLGKKELHKSEIDAEKLVQNALSEINHSLQHNARVIVNPLPTMYADPTLLTQVLINLLTNALKYSAKVKEPVIEIGFHEEENETIYFVRDNGAGFDMQYADRLFGVFQRLHGEQEFEGTGIGLSIVKRIIAKHRGRVWAEGKVNEGATFYFSLPKQ